MTIVRQRRVTITSFAVKRQMNKEERIFLEVVRVRGDAAGNEFQFSARCEKCRTKVFLVATGDGEDKNDATGDLHVRLVFNEKLLVCRNSLLRKKKP